MKFKFENSVCIYFLAFFVAVFKIQVTLSVKWLALSHVSRTWNISSHCPATKEQRKKFGLVGYQSKLCRRFTVLMPTIMTSTKYTSYVCKNQFEDRRWNCSTVDFAPKLTPDLTKGTREQAYIYGLSAAAISHGIAKACSSGQIPLCPCGHVSPKHNSNDKTWRWGGCSDNVYYGSLVSIEWADAPWRRKKRGAGGGRRDSKFKRYGPTLSDGIGATSTSFRNQRKGKEIAWEDFMKKPDGLTAPRAKMNQHNNEVGRKVVEQSMKQKCKCHGVSSSCEMKTCWKTLPSLHEIGETLKEKYGRAAEVKPAKRTQTTLKKLSFEPVAMFRPVTNDDLVYIRKSPDYCTEDRRVGSFGTKGRLCNASIASHSSCDSMCCGRGYETITVKKEEPCHCKYVHCCYVKCKTCSSHVDEHYCK